MTEEAVNSREAALAEKLARVGVPVTSQLSGPEDKNQSLPICALWHESLPPLPYEVNLLEDLALTLLGFPLAKEKRELSAPGANTVILRKDGKGQWRYRRSNWEFEKWSGEPKSLIELAAELAPRLPSSPTT